MGQLMGRVKGGLGISVTIVGALSRIHWHRRCDGRDHGSDGSSHYAKQRLQSCNCDWRNCSGRYTWSDNSTFDRTGFARRSAFFSMAGLPACTGQLLAFAALCWRLIRGRTDTRFGARAYVWLYQVTIAISFPSSCPPTTDSEETLDLKPVLAAFLPPIVLVIVLGSILGGIATPTEAAAIGAVGAMLMAGYKLDKTNPKPVVVAGLYHCFATSRRAL